MWWPLKRGAKRIFDHGDERAETAWRSVCVALVPGCKGTAYILSIFSQSLRVTLDAGNAGLFTGDHGLNKGANDFKFIWLGQYIALFHPGRMSEIGRK